MIESDPNLAFCRPLYDVGRSLCVFIKGYFRGDVKLQETFAKSGTISEWFLNNISKMLYVYFYFILFISEIIIREYSGLSDKVV